jgi:hypothetical protein
MALLRSEAVALDHNNEVSEKILAALSKLVEAT